MARRPFPDQQGKDGQQDRHRIDLCRVSGDRDEHRTEGHHGGGEKPVTRDWTRPARPHHTAQLSAASARIGGSRMSSLKPPEQVAETSDDEHQRQVAGRVGPVKPTARIDRRIQMQRAGAEHRSYELSEWMSNGRPCVAAATIRRSRMPAAMMVHSLCSRIRSKSDRVCGRLGRRRRPACRRP